MSYFVLAHLILELRASNCCRNQELALVRKTHYDAKVWKTSAPPVSSASNAATTSTSVPFNQLMVKVFLLVLAHFLKEVLQPQPLSETSQTGFHSSQSIVRTLFQLCGRGTGMMPNKAAQPIILFTYSVLWGRMKVLQRRDHVSSSNKIRGLLL